MITPNQFKRGIKIEVDGVPYSVVEFLHIKCGRGGATVRTKMKSLLNGSVIEKTFKSDEKINQPDFEEKEMQYLYSDGENYYFMDNESYEQIAISSNDVGSDALFMPENETVKVLIFNGKPIGVELPNFVELEVVETDPGLKGDTVSGGSKPAKLSTGGVINVPLFINNGDILKVDTRDGGSYIERVKTNK
jgi:elongation factor P